MAVQVKVLAKNQVLVFFLIQLLAVSTGWAQQPEVENGFVNAQQWNFREDRLALAGEWNWYNFELFDPAAVNSKTASQIDFPKLWNDALPQADGVQGQGYATYSLKALLPKDIDEYAIEVPQMYSCYSLWINNQLVAGNGVVGKDAETSVPQWKPQTVSFVNDRDTLQIVLQIANFHHSKGGCKEPIFLGKAR